MENGEGRRNRRERRRRNRIFFRPGESNGIYDERGKKRVFFLIILTWVGEKERRSIWSPFSFSLSLSLLCLFARGEEKEDLIVLFLRLCGFCGWFLAFALSVFFLSTYKLGDFTVVSWQIFFSSLAWSAFICIEAFGHLLFRNHYIFHVDCWFQC